jgi:hypothetical protein
MNDATTLAAIRDTLDEYFRGQSDHYEVLNRIAYITGLNEGAK